MNKTIKNTKGYIPVFHVYNIQAKENFNHNLKPNLSVNSNSVISIFNITNANKIDKTFGDKIYNKVDEINNEIDCMFQNATDNNETDVTVNKIKQIIDIETQKIEETAKQYYGNDIATSAIAKVDRYINRQAEKELEKYYTEYNSKKMILHRYRHLIWPLLINQ